MLNVVQSFYSDDDANNLPVVSTTRQINSWIQTTRRQVLDVKVRECDKNAKFKFNKNAIFTLHILREKIWLVISKLEEPDRRDARLVALAV